MERIVSGARPTGHLHIGNYFGAVKNFVSLQHEHQCFFFIADYHSLTTHPKAADLHANVKSLLATYIACGLDPEKTVLYVQSDVPEIAELYLLMNMLAYKGELERSTTFKEKVATQKDNVNAGLLTYPVLMAADILIHKATKVPVGKDQQQHLEMTRNFANRFNFTYGAEFFPEPQAFNYGGELVKILALDGSGKMGKSGAAGNAIFLNEEPESIRKKVMRAVTDSGPTEKNQPKPEYIENLFTLMKFMSATDTLQHFDEAYNNMAIRYGDLKKQLAEDIVNFTAPIREKIEELAADEKKLSKIVQQGAERARESARETLNGARDLIGIRRF